MNARQQSIILLVIGSIVLLILAVKTGEILTDFGNSPESTQILPLERRRSSIRTMNEQGGGKSFADYANTVATGISRDQLRWALMDFSAAGLDWEFEAISANAAKSLRHRQGQWYLTSLAESLGLSRFQKSQCNSALAVIESIAFDDFQKSRTSEPGIGTLADPSEPPLEAHLLSSLIAPGQWLTDLRLAPWQLCDLSSRQSEITWQKSFEAELQGASGRVDDWTWLTAFDSAWKQLDPETGEVHWNDFTPVEFPSELDGAGNILPFVRSQASPTTATALPGQTNEELLITQLLTLHPQQFRLMLLLRSGTGFTATVRDALARSEM